MLLTMPKMAGAADLRRLVEDLPAGRALEVLGVSQRTMRRYLEAEASPPSAVFHALFWYSRWGDSEILSRYGFENQILRGLVRAHAGQLADQATRPASNTDLVQLAPALRLVS